MEDIFATQASNGHQSLLLKTPDAWPSIANAINRRSLRDGWAPPEFTFQAVDSRATQVPGICTVYLPGVLAFRADLRSSLFPQESAAIEFLPIVVGKEPWLLLNCLTSAKQIDEQQSQVMRGANGEIFMVLKLRVMDPAMRASELFTLADSNRGQLFVRSPFKERVEALRLKGITFQKIGELV